MLKKQKLVIVLLMMQNSGYIRLAADLQSDSIVDGPGLRTVIWTQGCAHHCKGCQNPSTHDFKGGYLEDVDNLKEEIKALDIDGITLSGGDPMFQVEASLEIAKYAKSLGLNVWCYTGYTYEELMAISKTNKKMLDLLNNIDALVDGRFELDQLSYEVVFRGSKNQRIIDVASSLKVGKAIEFEKYKIGNTQNKANSDNMIFI